MATLNPYEEEDFEDAPDELDLGWVPRIWQNVYQTIDPFVCMDK